MCRQSSVTRGEKKLPWPLKKTLVVVFTLCYQSSRRSACSVFSLNISSGKQIWINIVRSCWAPEGKREMKTEKWNITFTSTLVNFAQSYRRQTITSWSSPTHFTAKRHNDLSTDYKLKQHSVCVCVCVCVCQVTLRIPAHTNLLV